MTSVKNLVDFPKIWYLSDVIETINKNFFGRKKPTLKFSGTVKCHGTNISIVQTSNGIVFQGRNNILPKNDRFGVHDFFKDVKLDDIFGKISQRCQLNPAKIAIFGEFCGKGIQTEVAISKVPKFFIVFAIYIVTNDNKNMWLNLNDYSDIHLPECRIYNIKQFPTAHITIDFENPEIAKKQIDDETEKVYKQCPVAKILFNINGPGEGYVWACSDSEDDSKTDNKDCKRKEKPHSYYKYVFKSKGDKFMPTKKQSTELKVTLASNLNDFVDKTLTHVRFKQGIDHLTSNNLPITTKSMLKFIEFIRDDILKEEDTLMKSSGLNTKECAHIVMITARKMYAKYCSSL